MEIQRYISDILDSNMYIVSEQGHGIIIDPSVDQVNVNELNIDYIILTHEHYDHIKAANYWKEKTEAKILCSSECAVRAANPAKNMSKYIDVFCELQTWIEMKEKPRPVSYICEADISYTEDSTIDWFGHKIKIIITPGHTFGCICLLFDDKFLFSGDSLMKDYPVACTGPGGSKKKWKELSIAKLKDLSGDVFVYPGHFEGFKLSDYRFWNEY